MKKLLLLFLASLLFLGCNSNKLDSKIESAIKSVYGQGYTEASFKNITTFELSYEKKGIRQQQNDIQPLVWKLDKIAGVLNSGEMIDTLHGDMGIRYSYSWETPELFIVLTSRIQLKYSIPRGEDENNCITIIITYK